MEKKLYRSVKDKKLCGVCSGMAEYFSIDPTLIRLGCVLLSLFGPGLLIYIVCAIVIPEKPDEV